MAGEMGPAGNLVCSHCQPCCNAQRRKAQLQRSPALQPGQAEESETGACMARRPTAVGAMRFEKAGQAYVPALIVLRTSVLLQHHRTLHVGVVPDKAGRGRHCRKAHQQEYRVTPCNPAGGYQRRSKHNSDKADAKQNDQRFWTVIKPQPQKAGFVVDQPACA